MIGYGDHWRLEEEEAKDLGNKLHEVVASMEGSNPYLEKMMEIVGKVGPWVSLIGTAAIITAPRIALTKMQLAHQREAAPDIEPASDPVMNGNAHAAYSRMGL